VDLVFYVKNEYFKFTAKIIKLFINPISFGRAGGIYQELGVSPTANLLTKKQSS